MYNKKHDGFVSKPSRFIGDPYGNRTHVFALRGRRLSRLTNGPYCKMYYTTQKGFCQEKNDIL